MKRTLHIYGILFLFILMLLQAQNVVGQAILYENFDYAVPGYIGGNGAAGTSSNNWTTHSVTAGQTTTIDVITGNLTYTGFMAPSGNKVLLFSNANATSRDINRGFTSTNTTLYFSALINIVDNSQITTTGDYFMHFAATSGSSVSTFGGRLGVKSVNTGANFRFIIQNTSTGTPTFTEFAQDMSFGTTYLVVVKYDRNSSPTVATLWVNPSSMGGSEPAGYVSNASGTATFPSFASICLRNNAVTPKAEIDEIRVGATFADVTPIGSHSNPPVATFAPANSATDVLTWVKPTITFDESVRKTDGSALTDGDLSSIITFRKTDASGANVSFTATIDAPKKIITITPTAALDNSQLYYLAVGPVEDISGNESLLQSASFTTISSASPAITLKYPIGGERLYAGQPVTVTWTSANITNVFVEVWVPDELTGVYSWFSYIASTPGAPGSVSNTVPIDAPFGTEYKVRVSDLSNPSVNSEGGYFTIIEVATTLADLRTNGKESDIIKYTGTATVTYARTSYNQKYIQDATGAILIHDPSGFVTGTYNIGDGITNVEGKITLYNSLVEIVPQAATGATATGTPVVPQVVDITTLTSADQSKLLKIKNLRFTNPLQWDATTGLYIVSKNYDLLGLSNLSYAFRTAFSESDYIGTAVPSDAFDAVVLVGQFGVQMQVTPRNLADMTLIPTGIDKTFEKNLKLYPIPATSELNALNIQDVNNIEILDMTGKVVMKLNAADMNEIRIPLNNLTRGLYFIKFTTDKGIVIKRFIKS